MEDCRRIEEEREKFSRRKCGCESWIEGKKINAEKRRADTEGTESCGKKLRRSPEVKGEEGLHSSEELRKYEEELRKRAAESGPTADLGLELESLEPGHVVFSMKVKERHKQMHGVVHGGVLATLADTVAAIAAYTTLPKGAHIATVELKINYLEAVPEGRLKAEGRVLRTGRNFVVAECEIFKEGGALAAKALMTFGAASGKSLGKG